MEPGPKRPGRPTKLNPETRDKLLLALRLGATKTLAAEYADISPVTLHRWLIDDRPEYLAFQADVEQVMAEVRVLVVANVVRLSATSTRAALAWLSVMGGPEWRRIRRRRCDACGKRMSKEEWDRAAPVDPDGDPPNLSNEEDGVHD